MSDPKVEHPAVKAGNTKSSETVPAAQSGHSGGSPRPATPVARWRQLHHKSSIILISLGALGIIVYLLRSGLGKEYEGFGPALCAVACGGFLVWHAIHLFAEQDKLEEEQFHANHPTASPLETNQTTPPVEAEKK